ncbi:MAG: HPr family phosphocarrier protein [Phycisphaerales bacterium]
MERRRTAIRNRLGLHARPAMTFASTAGGFRCDVRVRRGDDAERVDGKSVMQMLMLACTHGTEIEIECEGPDEREAMDALMKLIESRFEEE